VTDYFEYDDGGALVHARYDVTYNRRDQVLMEKSRTKQGSDWIYAHSVNFYTETGDAVSAPEITVANAAGTSTGAILYVSRTKNWKNGSFTPIYGTPGAYSQADLDYADAVVTNSCCFGCKQRAANARSREFAFCRSHFC